MAIHVTFVTHYRQLYGANRSLLDLLDGLGSRVAAHVVAPRSGDITRALKERGVPVSIIPFRNWAAPRKNSASSFLWPLRRVAYTIAIPGAARRVARAVREHGSELVYSNSGLVDVGARAARMSGLPHIWHIREFGRPDYDLDFFLGHDAAVREIRNAGIVVANSVAVRNYHFGDDSSVTVIENGVKRAAEFGIAPPAPPQGPFTFAIVGLLGANKNQAEAIEALAVARRVVPSIRLLIAGGGDDRDLRDLARCRGIEEAVEFLGYVADPFAVFERAHAALMCSTHEAWGRVTAEAMAVARPVIGRASAGTPALIGHERTGLLYESTEDLASAMIRLAQSPQTARELGVAAWNEARRRFTIEQYAGAVFAEIERAIVEKRR